MKNMTIEKIVKACGGTLYVHGRPVALREAMEDPHGKTMLTEKEAEGVVLDSRQVGPGFVFIAAKGEKVDGHSFIPQVFEKKALAVICEKVPEGVSGLCILVEDSFAALQKVAAYYRSQIPQVKIVGITGSVGKTSTKEFVASVLSRRYQTYKTEKNFNNEVGVPLTILKIREEHQAAVIEMGINHFGEMHRLSAMVQPNICVLTNIGQCHLEFLGSRDGILQAKSEIFDYMKEDGYVCVNGDDDKLVTIKKVKGRSPIRFGLRQPAPGKEERDEAVFEQTHEEGESLADSISRAAQNDLYATQIEEQGLLGSRAVLHIPGEQPFGVHIPLPGRHMVYNALAAAAVGGLLGLNAEEIRRGIEAVRPVEGRSRILRGKSYNIIDDCYNANPVSTKAALDLLNLAEGRKVAVLGDMFELGEKEAKLHAEVGAYAVEQGIDCLVCAGALSRFLYEGALKAKERTAHLGKKETEIHYFKNREELLVGLPGILRPKDNILIKASHGMGFGAVVDLCCKEA